MRTPTGLLREYDELILFLVLLGLTVFFIFEARELAPDPRLVPLLTLGLALVLILIKLVILLISARGMDLTSAMDKLIPDGSVVSKIVSFESEQISMHQADEGEPTSPIAFLKAVAWSWMFAIGLYVFGVVLAVPLLMFLFLLLESSTSLLKNVLITGITFAFIYLVFIEFLNIIVYEGLIGIGV